ncbi:hypothetical protein [Myceligenerans crystallogenes]|uniref:Uncharacterized protein n=1 Tax=Myceligenerans crystallogenes TaxID=316335 RepID=A0ABN2NCD9_9MICO
MPSLLLPASLSGDAESVRRAWRPLIRTALATGSWPEEVELAEAGALPGLIALVPAPLLAGEVHVHAWVPAALLADAVQRGAVPAEAESRLFTSALGSPWALLGLLAPGHQLLVLPPDRHLPFARAVARAWAELDAPGARYTAGLREGSRLWDVPSGLHYVLGRLGVPEAKLRAALPAGGPGALLPAGA